MVGSLASCRQVLHDLANLAAAAPTVGSIQMKLIDTSGSPPGDPVIYGILDRRL